jgi:hypothetical protein
MFPDHRSRSEFLQSFAKNSEINSKLHYRIAWNSGLDSTWDLNQSARLTPGCQLGWIIYLIPVTSYRRVHSLCDASFSWFIWPNVYFPATYLMSYHYLQPLTNNCSMIHFSRSTRTLPTCSSSCGHAWTNMMEWFTTGWLITLLTKNLSLEQSTLCPRSHSTRDWYAIPGLAFLSLTAYVVLNLRMYGCEYVTNDYCGS